MSSIMKYMTIITGNRFAASRKELATYPEIIVAGGYSPEDILGTVYICWFKELDELYSFPKEHLVCVAKMLTEFTNELITGKALEGIDQLYPRAIMKGYLDKVYPAKVYELLNKERVRYYLITKNVSNRVISFNNSQS